MPKDHAKIYTNSETVLRWKKAAKQTKYGTLSALGRIAIELLIKYPDLPDRLIEPSNNLEIEAMRDQIRMLTKQVRALRERRQFGQVKDNFFEK